jgi:hypothetical protein
VTVALARRGTLAQGLVRPLYQEILKDGPMAWYSGNSFNDGQIGAPLGDATANNLYLNLWNDGAAGAGYPQKTGRITADIHDTIGAQQFHPGSNFYGRDGWPQFDFTGDFTVECWIQPAAADLSGGTYKDLIVKPDAGSGELAVAYGLRIAYVAPDYRLRAYVKRSDGVKFSTQQGAPLTGSGLHHVCLSHQTTTSSILQLWLDGLGNSPQILNPLPPVPGSGPLSLGQADRTSNVNGYSGILDEICLYNKALASNRIAAHYHAGVGF